MGSMNSAFFYQDKPLFGLDIGFNSLKVIQVEGQNKEFAVAGYGVTSFDPKAIVNGVIVDPESIARVAHELFAKNLIGNISTRRVNVAIPASKTFNRTITLPKLAKKDLDEAVRLEAEQYIPVPIDELYIDYGIITENEKGIELLAVAVPKKIIDSYMTLMNLLGLEVVMYRQY
jgi:type IV pilus assembly protein PilM